jgi:hypothetical protein
MQCCLCCALRILRQQRVLSQEEDEITGRQAPVCSGLCSLLRILLLFSLQPGLVCLQFFLQ